MRRHHNVLLGRRRREPGRRRGGTGGGAAWIRGGTPHRGEGWEGVPLERRGRAVAAAARRRRRGPSQLGSTLPSGRRLIRAGDTGLRRRKLWRPEDEGDRSGRFRLLLLLLCSSFTMSSRCQSSSHITRNPLGALRPRGVATRLSTALSGYGRLCHAFRVA